MQRWPDAGPRKVWKRFMDTVEAGGLSVAKALLDFMNDEALPETGIAVDRFWDGLGAIIRGFAPRNRKLLDLRDTLQARIDDFHRARRGRPFDVAEYERFLHDIEYLAPEPPDFSIRTANVDDEIAHIAGPQLVVPLSNARYALNAANARWGSLYDALYGTDPIPEDGGATRGSARAALARPQQFVGFLGEPGAPSAILLRNHGLHLEIRIDRSRPVARDDPPGLPT